MGKISNKRWGMSVESGGNNSTKKNKEDEGDGREGLGVIYRMVRKGLTWKE